MKTGASGNGGQISRVAGRIEARLGTVERWELWILGAAMAATVLLVWAYVLGIEHELGGDEIGYHADALLYADGHWLWSASPFGNPHPSAWKTPIYPIWLGGLYSFLGVEARGAGLIQGLLLAPLTVLLTWLLARRLFTPPVAAIAAVLIAAFPLSWEYFGLLFPEALAIPFTLAALLVFVDREPTPRLAALTGFLIGVNMLIRPSAMFLAVACAASFIVVAGLRRGVAMTALAGLVAVLTIAPWTVRNAIELDGLIPLSVQDAAVYGTFNEESAADNFQWRPVLQDPPEAFARLERGEIGEPELRSELYAFAGEYIRDHPASVVKAAFHNGIRRIWDLRPPSEALTESDFAGRSRTVRGIGLAMYYLLLPAALIGLWRLRRRRELFYPVLVTVASIALIFAVIGTTRYRAPLEPVIAILAASAAIPLLDRRRSAPARNDAGG